MANSVLFVTVALCCLVASPLVHGLVDLTGHKAISIPATPSLIDRLRLDYIVLERDLWNLIYLENDKSVSLEAVHKAHLSFFRSDFGESHVPLDEIDPDHLQLYHAFSAINRTVSVVVKNYLHSNPLRFDQKRTLAICRQLANLTYHLDGMNAVMADTDFFNTIKNVSELVKTIQSTDDNNICQCILDSLVIVMTEL